MAVPPVIELPSSLNSAPTNLPSSSHRLPTVSASQALQSFQNDASSFIQTGIRSLDALLAGVGSAVHGGFERGKVTEIWGPSGAGKTAIALQAAANVVANDSVVIWVDATTPLSASRLQSTVATSTAWNTSKDLPQGLRHVTVATLSHLLAIILHSPPAFFPPNSSLFVIDGLNAVIDLDYPRWQNAGSTKTDQQKWQAGRRYAVLGSVVSALNKLAVLNNMAVIVTTGCSTRMRSESGLSAALVPGIGGVEWDSGIWNRLSVFQDLNGRFVGVQKCQGKSLIPRDEVGEAGRLIGFDISVDGSLRERMKDRVAHAVVAPSPKEKAIAVKPAKRTFDEIADSEDEDVDEYGWLDSDEAALVTGGLMDEATTTETE